jgi:hypothetical protein
MPITRATHGITSKRLRLYYKKKKKKRKKGSKRKKSY